MDMAMIWSNQPDAINGTTPGNFPRKELKGKPPKDVRVDLPKAYPYSIWIVYS